MSEAPKRNLLLEFAERYRDRPQPSPFPDVLACTPRCGDLHAVDCPRYRGPLSPSHSLTEPPTGADVAKPGQW